MTKEQLKYENVKNNIEDKILFYRFSNLEELNQLLKKEFDIQASESDFSKENVEETGCDYALISGINNDWGYVDIYYLIDNQNRLLITELTISEE